MDRRIRRRTLGCRNLARSSVDPMRMNPTGTMGDRQLADDAGEEVPIPALIVRIRTRWPVLVGAILVGALGGLAFSAVRVPVYQATAAIAFNIDYGSTARLPLIVEDRVLDRVWQLLVADATIAAVASGLQADGWEEPALTDVAALRRQMRVDQRLARWELNTFDEDPGFAAAVSNAWGSVAIERLAEAQDHAWRALELQASPFVVQCFSEAPEGSLEEAFWACLTAAPGLDPSIVGQLREEMSASRGILPNLSYELVQSATPPVAPVLWDRGVLILSGSLAALVACILALSSASVLPSRSSQE